MLSERQRATLVAIAEAALPAGRLLPAAGAHTVEKVEQLFAHLPDVVQRGMGGLLAGLDAQSWISERRSFVGASNAARLAVLDRWRSGDALRRLALRALLTPLKVAHFDDPKLYQQLGCVYEIAKPRAEAKPAYLRDRVHDGAALGGDLAIECDVVVIGTGAGGAVVGKELAEGGAAVVFVEEGRYFDRTDFTGRPFEMQQKMYRRGGSTFSVGNVAIPIPIGQSVGGTTTINSGTCYRPPSWITTRWRDELGLPELGPDALAPYLDRVEGVLGVAPASRAYLGGNGRVIQRGCEALGFTRHGPLRRNAPDCDGQGVCVFGCPTDAKRSTNVSYIPMALRAGAELFTASKVTRIIVDGGRATGIVARTADGSALTIHARAVVVAAGAIMTPLLLSANGLANASGELGKNLSIHPATGCLAELDEPVQPWKGIPQGYGIEELHEEGILFEGAMVPLEFSMSMTQMIGPGLIELAESFDRVASFGFLVEDTAHGSVRAVRGQPVIQYWLSDKDVAHIKRGVDVLAQVFFAAGARRVHTPIAGFDTLSSPAELDQLRRTKVRPWDLDLTAYHPLGTARMGRDPARSVVDANHQVHDCRGLFVVDGAAVPSSLGVNPQITIMALATRAAEKIAATLG